ncbi:hypothetical protein GW755_03540 [bacterium]|nr:hypothetical protein [bacterium]
MSNLYCVLKIKDKQYFVTEGDIVKTHPITIEEPIQILLLRDNEETYLGDPVVENGGVEISVIGVNRIKTDVRRYKSKSRYRKNKSHSQEFSILKIIKIGSKLKGVNITVIKEDEETKEVLVKKTAEKEVKEVKEVKVDTLGFSTRIITALTKNKINTVSQLADLSKDQIIALDGLGKKSAEEILNKLGK